MHALDALNNSVQTPFTTKSAFIERGPATDSDAFRKQLETDHASGKAKSSQDKEAQLRQAAGQLVSAAFILPLLAETRDSAFKSDLFGGGFAQDSIQQKLDVKLADAVATSGRFPLTDALVRQFTRPEPVQNPEVSRFA